MKNDEDLFCPNLGNAYKLNIRLSFTHLYTILKTLVKRKDFNGEIVGDNSIRFYYNKRCYLSGVTEENECFLIDETLANDKKYLDYKKAHLIYKKIYNNN